ncbi:hypothetical protein Ssi03_13040 [Sphaerisporangium siamense]|uniref:Uncharacterized protein n=1 Tax=Sphaerisporangium siamense TaxID=795645 RepID=A0A7W7D9V1_9ACTN|nr:hypothetical protein [Sphaerisporangium siamense]MBB4702927.1 hypothetical protein [Sphaerisporangium siamense]GII83314.1 hypothetical protein Ssi03_13040 [Sphaerisporangium siamense]
MLPISDEDRKDYPYIIGYCHFIGSLDTWTAYQVQLARQFGAPRTAFRIWIEPVNGALRVRTPDVCSAEFRERLAAHMRRHGLDCHELDNAAA